VTTLNSAEDISKSGEHECFQRSMKPQAKYQT